MVAGVRLARDRGLKVSVRAGGHSWAAWSLQDDALLIDLGRMGEMAYDPATGIATVSPAVKGGAELTPFLTSHGRAFPGGHCPSVGIGGFLLQGGQGWNSRKYGWACENVTAIDVVTAAGELIRADEHENADLLWAARGAGPGVLRGRDPLPSAHVSDAPRDDPRHVDVRARGPRAAVALDRRAAALARPRGRAGDRGDAPAPARGAAGAVPPHDRDVRDARGSRARARTAGRLPDR